MGAVRRFGVLQAQVDSVLLGGFAACFAGLAAAGFMPRWIAASALMFWTLGFASATFDIAADGFYMLALDEKSQSFFVGIRNAFYRAAVLFGQGATLVIAGKCRDFSTPPRADGRWRFFCARR